MIVLNKKSADFLKIAKHDMRCFLIGRKMSNDTYLVGYPGPSGNTANFVFSYGSLICPDLSKFVGSINVTKTMFKDAYLVQGAHFYCTNLVDLYVHNKQTRLEDSILCLQVYNRFAKTKMFEVYKPGDYVIIQGYIPKGASFYISHTGIGVTSELICTYIRRIFPYTEGLEMGDYRKITLYEPNF